jgi:hypothetical protein
MRLRSVLCTGSTEVSVSGLAASSVTLRRILRRRAGGSSRWFRPGSSPAPWRTAQGESRQTTSCVPRSPVSRRTSHGCRTPRARMRLPDLTTCHIGPNFPIEVKGKSPFPLGHRERRQPSPPRGVGLTSIGGGPVHRGGVSDRGSGWRARTHRLVQRCQP